MSVAAVLMVRDEADIIGPTIRHLLTQVDAIYVADNLSTDGTREILESFGSDIILSDDPELGYYQSRKMTALASVAYRAGHSWVVPCDADEIWYATGSTLREHLGGIAGDVAIVSAELYDHIPTSEDDPTILDPVARIGWRKRYKGALPKVACRLRPDLVIDAGNHSASYRGPGLRVPGLTLRHFTWRSPEQYVRKILNGKEAYAATDLPEGLGIHWRMWEGHEEGTIRQHFYKWFYSRRPREDDTLIFDPAPTGATNTEEEGT